MRRIHPVRRGFLILLFLAAALPCLTTPASGQELLERFTSHVVQGWPWKIPLVTGEGTGIAFLLGIDNRLTAYDLDSGTAVWSFQMGMGAGQYMYTPPPLYTTKDGRTVVLLLDNRGYLHAVDIRTGMIQWRTYDGLRFLQTPGLAGDWVLAVSVEGALYKMDAATGEGSDPENPGSRLFDKGRSLIARPTVVLDADESIPMFIVCLAEDRPGERYLMFLDFMRGKEHPKLTERLELADLTERPVSAPLFSTGRHSARGQSTMRIFVAVRRGSDELVYQKDYSKPRHPFTLFYRVRGGRICERPTFTHGGYVVLPNTSGRLMVLRPDGRELKSIRVAETEGAMSVYLMEEEKADYGVLLVQTAEGFGAYVLSLENRLAEFGRFYPFKVWSWEVISTRADVQWETTKSPFVGEPRLPLHIHGDYLLYNSQVKDAAFLAAYPRGLFMERNRKEAPKAAYVRTTKPGGSEFLSFHLMADGNKMLVGYGDLGTYIVDAESRRVLRRTTMKTKLTAVSERGPVIFSEDEKDGVFFGIVNDDLKSFRFKETHIADEVTSRPLIAGDRIYFTGRTGVYARPLAADGELVSMPLHVVSPPVLAGDILLVGTRSGFLQGLDARELTRKWMFDVDGIMNAPALVDGGSIYLGTSDGVIYGLPLKNAGGRLNRTDAFLKVQLKSKGAVSAPPLKLGDALYIASSVERGQTTLSKIDIADPADPKEVWTGIFYGDVTTPMLIHDDLLLFASSDRIVALDTTGERPRKLWDERLNDTIAGPLQKHGAALFFICRDGSIYRMDLEKRIFDVKF